MRAFGFKNCMVQVVVDPEARGFDIVFVNKYFLITRLSRFTGNQGNGRKQTEAKEFKCSSHDQVLNPSCFDWTDCSMENGARCWVRTSDPHSVSVVLYH